MDFEKLLLIVPYFLLNLGTLSASFYETSAEHFFCFKFRTLHCIPFLYFIIVQVSKKCKLLVENCDFWKFLYLENIKFRCYLDNKEIRFNAESENKMKHFIPKKSTFPTNQITRLSFMKNGAYFIIDANSILRGAGWIETKERIKAIVEYMKVAISKKLQFDVKDSDDTSEFLFEWLSLYDEKFYFYNILEELKKQNKVIEINNARFISFGDFKNLIESTKNTHIYILNYSSKQYMCEFKNMMFDHLSSSEENYKRIENILNDFKSYCIRKYLRRNRLEEYDEKNITFPVQFLKFKLFHDRVRDNLILKRQIINEIFIKKDSKKNSEFLKE